MAQKDNVNAGIISVVGFAGCVLTFASILWLQGYYAKTQRAEDSRKADSIQRNEYKALRDSQLAHINKDQAIDLAMQRVTQAIRLNPSAATPPQPSAVAPAGATAPPAGATPPQPSAVAPAGATAPPAGATPPRPAAAAPTGASAPGGSPVPANTAVAPASTPPAPPALNQVQP